MTSRTLRLPVHLVRQSQRWLDGQEEVRSFTHLVRIAVVDYITEEGGHVEQRMHERLLREMEELNQKLERSLALKKEAEDAVVKLTRAYGYDVSRKSYLTKKKREREEPRHQRQG